MLPSNLIKLSRQYGIDVVAAIARGEFPATLARAYRDADKKPEVWQRAKMAECVFAIEHGLDPLTAVNWTGLPDRNDILLGGKRFEIKSSHPRAKYLLWPIAKNDRYETAQFDVLVLTKVSLRYEVGYSDGWVTKQEFSDQHLVAGPNHDLDEGTWYMEQSLLHDMQELKKIIQQDSESIVVS